MLDPTA